MSCVISDLHRHLKEGPINCNVMLHERAIIKHMPNSSAVLFNIPKGQETFLIYGLLKDASGKIVAKQGIIDPLPHLHWLHHCMDGEL